MNNSKMTFQKFKEQWEKNMITEEDEDTHMDTMVNLYKQYKKTKHIFGKDVREWCKNFHQDCTLETHIYEFKKE